MARQFVAGFAVAAALAAAGWFFVAAPQREDAERRAAAADEAVRRARREASDAAQWAETERDRNRLLDEKVKELERVLASTRPPRDPKDPPRRQETPEDWTRDRLNQEIENLAGTPQMAERHGRYALVVRALKSRPDESVKLITEVLTGGFDSAWVATVAALADGLGDARVVPALLERWKTETEGVARIAVARALANLPGDVQVPALEAAWSDAKADPNVRKFAIHGLALRGHAVARSAADGTGGATPAQRVRAIESLRAFAERGGWTDASLVPVFAAALRTADGPAQRKLALIALEGLWSKDAAPALRAFAADPASPPELALRAGKLAADVEAGAPRPAGAGVPERGLVTEGGE